MIFRQDSATKTPQSNSAVSSCKQTEECDSNCSIQQFFDERVFVKNIAFQQSSLKQPQKGQLQTAQPKREECGNGETETVANKRSIFHNFQKHVITLLRKTIKIKYSSANPNQSQLLALTIWNTFKKVNSYNKQTLQMIFGVCSTKNIKPSLQTISQKYRQFRAICNKYPLDMIQGAQGVIRRQVVQQMKKTNKNRVSNTCNVKKFEAFYSYLESFLLEIEQGPITTRMRKVRAAGVMEKLAQTPNQ